MTQTLTAKFGLGQVVRHREQSFRGVVIDVDAAYAGPRSEPGPSRPDQPFYQVYAMGPDGGFIAYAAEEVLEYEPDVMPLSKVDEAKWFNVDAAGRHAPRAQPIH